MMGKSYKQVSICFLDLYQELAVSLRSDPKKKHYLAAMGRLLELLKSERAWFGGPRAEAQEDWEGLLREILAIADLGDDVITTRVYCYPKPVPVMTNDLEVLFTLGAGAASLGANDEQIRDYADMIHNLPEILAHGRMDRKLFWKSSVKPYAAGYPGHLDAEGLKKIKRWASVWI
jgi:hypothetical protein